VNHVSTIFPEVRLKRFIEMRGSDGGPFARIPALPAFWIGLIYDESALDACWDLVKNWSAAERQKLRNDVTRLGLRATIGGRTLHNIATDVLMLARKGLERRARRDAQGRDETQYLEPLEEIVRRGKTPAEELLEKFHGPWGGSVDPVYREYAY
jgi:glutamate--cysteine ligase